MKASAEVSAFLVFFKSPKITLQQFKMQITLSRGAR